MTASIKIPEKDIQRAILEYLQLRGYACKRNNSGMMFSSYNGKKRAIKIGEAGWPDIEGITKEGRYFGIEVKAKTGRLTDGQQWIGDKIRKSNGLWFVARSLDDVIAEGL